MELVVVELNAGAELDATECMEVTGVEHVGAMDLGRGCGIWMEYGHDGKRKSEKGWRRQAAQAESVPRAGACSAE
jgi:hypothetical protein